MALTGRVKFLAYRKNQYDLKDASGKPATAGIPINLPSSLCTIYPAPTNTIANGATMQAIIELLPSGLYHNGQSDKFYTTLDVAGVDSAGS
jgi:hypothetical protein